MTPGIKIMGIVNVNDDSFFAGSRVSGAEQFAARVEKLSGEGADVIDIGACSSRPGSTYPGEEEEWRRMKPVLQIVRDRFLPRFADAGPGETYSGPRFSIDTFSATVVRRTFGVIGPFIVNDISAGQSDPELLPLVARLNLPYVAMHNQIPFVMEGKQLRPIADGEGDIVARVAGFFRGFEERATEAGLTDWILDPGFGFGKDVDENLELLDRVDELKVFGREILIGISRKRMTYLPLGCRPDDPEALAETIRLERLAISRGATWIRCHDIPQLK